MHSRVQRRTKRVRNAARRGPRRYDSSIGRNFVWKSRYAIKRINGRAWRGKGGRKKKGENMWSNGSGRTGAGGSGSAPAEVIIIYHYPVPANHCNPYFILCRFFVAGREEQLRAPKIIGPLRWPIVSAMQRKARAETRRVWAECLYPLCKPSLPVCSPLFSIHCERVKKLEGFKIKKNVWFKRKRKKFIIDFSIFVHNNRTSWERKRDSTCECSRFTSWWTDSGYKSGFVSKIKIATNQYAISLTQYLIWFPKCIKKAQSLLLSLFLSLVTLIP